MVIDTALHYRAMWLSIFNSSKFKLLVSIWYCDMICRSWLQWGWLLLASRAKIPIAESDSMALFVQISVQRTHWRLSITLHHHVCLNTCIQHTLTLTHSPVVMKILQTSSTFSSLSADRDVFITVNMFTSWARADSSGHWQPPAVHQSGHCWDVLLGVLCPGLEPCNWGGSGDGDDKQDVVTYLAVIRTKQTDKPTSLIHPYRSSR